MKPHTHMIKAPDSFPLVSRDETTSLRIIVKGVVQGVGFRPFCYRIARACGLSGHVLNSGDGVEIVVAGEGGALRDFLRRIVEDAPPLSSIETMEISEVKGDLPGGFRIGKSLKTEKTTTMIPPDISTCNDCLRELMDPGDRRYLYPFINCTNCGPRYTITRSLPYDRAQTTMASFRMCKACASEYIDPGDRRFHAEPTCCPRCGPGVFLEEGRLTVEGDKALERAAWLLREGKVVAIKGLGGFHIACDAFNREAVERVREAKKRPSKPLAVMMRDMELVKGYLECNPQEEALLASPRRPIVLLKKRQGVGGPFHEIAPNIDHVGVMLPYTPLHHLLFSHYGAPGVLVMTSGNRKGEPIVRGNDEAREKLDDMVDAFLFHDRPILRRVDDSVTCVVLDREHIIRRARGYVPVPVRISGGRMKNVVAFGGDLKNSACIGVGNELFLTQYIGDLASPDVQDHLLDAIEGLRGLLDVDFHVVVTDMHPDYHSSRLGEEYARRHGIELKRVQHHFAHLLQVVAEHNLQGQVLGCVLDGTGYGLDGNVWGGEVLYANMGTNGSRIPNLLRLGHLEYVPLPGGDRATEEPWRMAVAFLHSLGKGPELMGDRGLGPESRLIVEMIEKGVNTPLTSSAGRLFDAVAALLGVRYYNDFEGQAAMELETLARVAAKGGWARGRYHVQIKNRTSHPWIISSKAVVAEIINDIASGVPREEIAQKFHLWLASAMVLTLTGFARTYSVEQVALSGGVFQNRLLLEYVMRGLQDQGLKVYTGDMVPVNDGGIALGQAFCGGLLSCV